MYAIPPSLVNTRTIADDFLADEEEGGGSDAEYDYADLAAAMDESEGEEGGEGGLHEDEEDLSGEEEDDEGDGEASDEELSGSEGEGKGKRTGRGGRQRGSGKKGVHGAAARDSSGSEGEESEEGVSLEGAEFSDMSGDEMDDQSSGDDDGDDDDDEEEEEEDLSEGWWCTLSMLPCLHSTHAWPLVWGMQIHCSEMVQLMKTKKLMCLFLLPTLLLASSLHLHFRCHGARKQRP
jgi:hypothetical protein